MGIYKPTDITVSYTRTSKKNDASTLQHIRFDVSRHLISAVVINTADDVAFLVDVFDDTVSKRVIEFDFRTTFIPRLAVRDVRAD